MKKTNLLSMAALALIMVASCNKNEIEQILPTTEQPAEADGITITAQLAPMTPLTRAVVDKGNKMEATWAKDEHLAILYTLGGNQLTADAVVTNVDESGKASIEFTISGEPDVPACTLVYPFEAAPYYAAGTIDEWLQNQTYRMVGLDKFVNDKLDFRVGAGEINTSTHSMTVSTPLAPQLAIIKLTIDGGWTILNNAYSLNIKDQDGNLITNLSADPISDTLFVAMKPATNKYFKFEATVSKIIKSNIINKSSIATLEAGKFYKSKLAPPALGDLYFSDGTYNPTMQTGKTPIGVIAYLSENTSDDITECGTNVGGKEFQGHGLVLCLRNAASGVNWGKNNNRAYSYDWIIKMGIGIVGDLKRSYYVSGYTVTNALGGSASDYPAAYQAKNYTGLPAPAGTTGWFLASAQQWVRMQSGLGELPWNSIDWGAWFNKPNNTGVQKWEDAMSKAGAPGEAYDSMLGDYIFWTCTEYNDGSEDYPGVVLRSGTSDESGKRGVLWDTQSKTSTNSKLRVRPVLAF
jgi:hypothetical protein